MLGLAAALIALVTALPAGTDVDYQLGGTAAVPEHVGIVVRLAAGQKNLAGFDGTRIGYDFAVAEECGRYRECAAYTRAYGARVLAVEFRPADFRWICERFGDRLAVVLRDHDLSPRGVHRWC